MSADVTIQPEVFVVNLSNRKLVTGTGSFGLHFIRSVVIALVLSVCLIGLVVASYSLRTRADMAANSGLSAITVTFIIVLLPLMVQSWRKVWRNRGLVGGQFLKGEVISANGSWSVPKKHKPKSFYVNVSYSFTAPDGRRIVQTDSAERLDLWTQTYEGRMGLAPTGDNTELNALLPKPGTPVKVLYRDDGLYQVM